MTEASGATRLVSMSETFQQSDVRTMAIGINRILLTTVYKSVRAQRRICMRQLTGVYAVCIISGQRNGSDRGCVIGEAGKPLDYDYHDGLSFLVNVLSEGQACDTHRHDAT